jgi:ABC-type maltose transport system permease subunit
MTTKEFYRVTPKCKTFSSQDFNTLAEATEFVRQEGIWDKQGDKHNYYDEYQMKHYSNYWREYAKTLVIAKITQTEEII